MIITIQLEAGEIIGATQPDMAVSVRFLDVNGQSVQLQTVIDQAIYQHVDAMSLKDKLNLAGWAKAELEKLKTEITAESTKK